MLLAATANADELASGPLSSAVGPSHTRLYAIEPASVNDGESRKPSHNNWYIKMGQIIKISTQNVSIMIIISAVR